MTNDKLTAPERKRVIEALTASHIAIIELYALATGHTQDQAAKTPLARELQRLIFDLTDAGKEPEPEYTGARTFLITIETVPGDPSKDASFDYVCHTETEAWSHARQAWKTYGANSRVKSVVERTERNPL